jgi:hypothetical protein
VIIRRLSKLASAGYIVAVSRPAGDGRLYTLFGPPNKGLSEMRTAMLKAAARASSRQGQVDPTALVMAVELQVACARYAAVAMLQKFRRNPLRELPFFTLV